MTDDSQARRLPSQVAQAASEDSDPVTPHSTTIRNPKTGWPIASPGRSDARLWERTGDEIQAADNEEGD